MDRISEHICIRKIYEGVSKSFRTGHLERELQMVQLSATRCSCIVILWVSLVSFSAITLKCLFLLLFISLSTQSGNFWIYPRILDYNPQGSNDIGRPRKNWTSRNRPISISLEARWKQGLQWMTFMTKFHENSGTSILIMGRTDGHTYSSPLGFLMGKYVIWELCEH
jgi:hypothetical protein